MLDAVLERLPRRAVRCRPVARRRAVASALVTDFHFGAPTEQFVRAHAAHGNRVSPLRAAVAVAPARARRLPRHVPAAGVRDHGPSARRSPATGADATRMSETVQDAWIAFIRAGDPSTPALGAWPAYDASGRATMLLGAEPQVVEHHRAAQMAVWEGRYPASG